MGKFQVVGIIGMAGHGKDTVCETALDISPRNYRHAFADKLKIECAKNFSEFPEMQVDIDEQGRISYQIPREEISEESEKWRRRIWQVWGTEGRRHIYEPWWLREWAVDSLKASIAGFQAVFVPDIRFPNEFDFIKETLGGIVIGVDRGGYRRPNTDYGHESEVHVPKLLSKADHVIESPYSTSWESIPTPEQKDKYKKALLTFHANIFETLKAFGLD